MRVQTAFNRLLRLPGAAVIDVSFGQEGVIVTVRLRRRRRVCSSCGQLGGHIHGRRVRRWRHLDLGASRCVIECELRRLLCRDCGVRYEAVPWAGAGSRYTRDFEDVVAWLAQQMAKNPIASMLRIAWDSAGRIVERVIAEHLDEQRLSGLIACGCDEISYRRGQRCRTHQIHPADNRGRAQHNDAGGDWTDLRLETQGCRSHRRRARLTGINCPAWSGCRRSAAYDPGMLTVEDAARRVGRSPETVRRWIRDGRLPAQIEGRRRVIDPVDLDSVRHELYPMLPMPPEWAHLEDGSPAPNWVAAVALSRNGR